MIAIANLSTRFNMFQYCSFFPYRPINTLPSMGGLASMSCATLALPGAFLIDLACKPEGQNLRYQVMEAFVFILTVNRLRNFQENCLLEPSSRE